MARIKNGIMGSFTGKVGHVVGCRLNGVDYMRSLPRPRTSTRVSEAEFLNRKKFAEAQAWLKPLNEFVRLGFKNYSQTCRGFIAAKSYLLKNAMVCNYPDAFVDPSLALVAHGDLQGCKEARAACEEAGRITFYWSTERTAKTTSNKDLVMLLAYDTVNHKATFDTAAAKRNAGKGVLEITDPKFGNAADVYLGFISSDHEGSQIVNTSERWN